MHQSTADSFMSGSIQVHGLCTSDGCGHSISQVPCLVFCFHRSITLRDFHFHFYIFWGFFVLFFFWCLSRQEHQGQEIRFHDPEIVGVWTTICLNSGCIIQLLKFENLNANKIFSITFDTMCSYAASTWSNFHTHIMGIHMKLSQLLPDKRQLAMMTDVIR